MGLRTWMRWAAAAVAAAVGVWPTGPLVAVAAENEGPAARLDEAAIARAVSALPRTAQWPPFAEADWSRVTSLAPGREIVVTTDAAPATRRRFVAADISGVTLLDLSPAQLPDHAKRVLRELLQQSPGSLVRVVNGGTLVRGRVRLAPEGVFLDGRRATALDVVLQHVARTDVVQIRDDREGSSAGLMVAAILIVPAGAALHAKSGGWRRPEPDINRGTLLGLGMMLTGATLGLTALKRGSAAGRTPLVYRRP